MHIIGCIIRLATPYAIDMAKPADQYCCNMIGRRWMRYGCSTAAADGVGGGISRRYSNFGWGGLNERGLGGEGRKKYRSDYVNL